MHMTLDQAQSSVPVTILAIHGDMDASNFEEVIARAKELYQAGVRYLLVDLSDMPFMGSSGLVALHSIALLMRGEEPPDPEAGWQAFHTIEQSRGSGVQQHVKLLNPQPKVMRTLEMTGIDEFFEIHTDRQAAVDSF
jgi:anti-anti-sigma regulatory factor